jgi:hypothetical protein
VTAHLYQLVENRTESLEFGGILDLQNYWLRHDDGLIHGFVQKPWALPLASTDQRRSRLLLEHHHSVGVVRCAVVVAGAIVISIVRV